MVKRKQRPIDVKDVMWSHFGKDELDKAAETLRDVLCEGDVLKNPEPYHIVCSLDQETMQRAVLAILGTTVPAMLRERARDYPETGDNLTDLAEELEEEHGV